MVVTIEYSFKIQSYRQTFSHNIQLQFYQCNKMYAFSNWKYKQYVEQAKREHQCNFEAHIMLVDKNSTESNLYLEKSNLYLEKLEKYIVTLIAYSNILYWIATINNQVTMSVGKTVTRLKIHITDTWFYLGLSNVNRMSVKNGK